jgi:peptidoglycan/xylan/chitin deacetylase (PgdA/CDA1 family)
MSRDAGRADGSAGPPTATPVERTAEGGRTVALTFDDGPNPADTPRLLDVLRAHDVRAVFCLWGDHVRAHPALVRRIVAEGHELGNHSMHHDDMADWPAERIRADLAETHAAIQDAAPGAAVPWFRAPFGHWGGSPAVAAGMGMQPLGWSLVPGDWDPPGAAELTRRLADGITPGGVVLLHDGGGDRSQTVAAVARIVPAFQARGWRFTLPAPRA